MESTFHSVRLVKEECKGCTNCIKHCPTEAIRVYQGKARIINELCIDCGECIRICPNHAKQTVSDPLTVLHSYQYRVAVLAPSFFGQFSNATMEEVRQAVQSIGFELVADVGYGAEHVNLAVRQWMRDNPDRPMISSACPAIVRLIQTRFGELLEHLIPVQAPIEVTAQHVREYLNEQGVAKNNVGVFFVTPCPAKISAIKLPLTLRSSIDGAISFRDIYGPVLNYLSGKLPISNSVHPFVQSSLGLAWGRRDGELAGLMGVHVSVDGIYNVINVLEEMAVGKLSDVDFLELQACPGGCVGGPLTLQNPYLAKANLERLGERLGKETNVDCQDFSSRYERGEYFLQAAITPRPALRFDEEIPTALEMINRQEIILNRLPGLDCGACGSPNCHSLAEDIVRSVAIENDCVFVLRESILSVATELWELAKQVPPTLAKTPEREASEDKSDETS